MTQNKIFIIFGTFSAHFKAQNRCGQNTMNMECCTAEKCLGTRSSVVRETTRIRLGLLSKCLFLLELTCGGKVDNQTVLFILFELKLMTIVTIPIRSGIYLKVNVYSKDIDLYLDSFSSNSITLKQQKREHMYFETRIHFIIIICRF